MDNFVARSIDGTALELQASGETLDVMAQALPLQGVTSALDVGCGTGAFTRAVARALGTHATVVGIDSSQDQVRQARTLAREECPDGLRFVQADILDAASLAPFFGKFDLVVCRYLLMYLVPVKAEQRAIALMTACARPHGKIACIEADVNFGHERYPPPSPQLVRLLESIVPYYREQRLIEWRSGVQLFFHLNRAPLTDIAVRVIDGRVIQGGLPEALARHAGRDIEDLIRPCLAARGEEDSLAELAREWRNYLARPDTFLYTPILLGTGFSRTAQDQPNGEP